MEPNVIQVLMNEENDYSIEITKYIGSNGEYFCVNNINYDIHFPIDWVFQIPPHEELEFGPETCYDCFQYGYYNGVFIGYCPKCASITNYQRGNGMIGNGIERETPELLQQNSIWNLYLQNTCLEEIGDVNLLNNYNYKYNIINDENTVDYDRMFIYSSCEDEDEVTIAFSEENNHNFVDVDSLEDIEDDDDDDDEIFMDIDSIS